MTKRDSTRPARQWLRTHTWVATLLAPLAGALLVLAFAPFAWRWLSVAMVAALMLLWLASTPAQAWRRGYLFGLGFFGCGVYWVYNSIYEFGHAPAALAALITGCFVLFLALFPAATGYVVNRFVSGSARLKLVLAYPAVWVLMEWLRGWLFTGFPWLLLGETQVDTPLAGMVPVLGVLGASWAVMLTAGLLAAAVVEARWRATGTMLAGAAALWLASGLLSAVPWTHTVGAPLEVSVIQGNIPQEQKWQPDRRGAILERYRELTAAHWSSDLVVWPETAIPTFYAYVARSFIEPLRAQARAHDTGLLVGVFLAGPQGRRVYNAVAALGEEGVEVYRKRHLVPFGEYIPLRGMLAWMGSMLVLPMSDLSAGTGRPLVHVDGMDVGVSICYEDAYGPEVDDALPEAGLLVNVSNDGWFGDSTAPHQHLEITRVRALETGRYLLRATNTGISAIVDPAGRLAGVAPQFETYVLSGFISRMAGLTPYGYWGNWAVLTLLIGCALVAAWPWRAAHGPWRWGRSSPANTETTHE